MIRMGPDLPHEMTDPLFLASSERNRMRLIERAFTDEGDLTADQREDLAEMYGGTERARRACMRAFVDWRDRAEAEESVRGRAGSGKQPVEQAQYAPSAEPGWRTCSKCAGKKSLSHGEKCYCAVGGRPGMERFADPADSDAFRCRTLVTPELRCGLLFGHAGGCVA